MITKACMSNSRFHFLLRYIHFDDYELRSNLNSLGRDRFEIFREVFEYVNCKFKTAFIPSSYLCVDEMLLKFRGRSKFRQYIKSKPGKFYFNNFSLLC